MLKSARLFLPVAVLMIVSLACSMQGIPSIPTLDRDSINTAIAQTVVVGLTQTGQPFIPITGLETQTPTLELPTPSATLSPTSTLSPTPSVPLITVSVATNCRVGPGRVYDRVGALLVGEVAEVVGRNPTGEYWYIRNPNVNGGFCWLWGEYAALVGNTAALPIFTPPPTPTPPPTSTPAPAFEASFDNLDSCSGNFWVDLRLKNTGGIAFKSVSVTVRDAVTKTVVTMSSDGFTDNDGCTGSSTRDNLDPGGDRVVSAHAFNHNPDGHRLRVTITVCSNKGLNGLCATQVIVFKP